MLPALSGTLFALEYGLLLRHPRTPNPRHTSGYGLGLGIGSGLGLKGLGLTLRVNPITLNPQRVAPLQSELVGASANRKG